jgi:hypothetical protein
MSTVSVIMQPSADGTLHIPVPAEWRHQQIRVKAEMEPIGETTKTTVRPDLKGFGCMKGKIWMAPDFDEPLEDFKEYME